MLAKIGPGRNLNMPLPRDRVVLDDLGAGDVGRHQVGRELDALEGQVERLGQRADHERLGQPGHADEQGVAAAEDGHQQLIEHLLLADDDLADLLAEPAVGVAELFDRLDIGSRHILAAHGESCSG